MDPPALRLDDSLSSLARPDASFPASAHGTMVYSSAVTPNLLLAAVQKYPCPGSLAQTSTYKNPVAIHAVSRPPSHMLAKLDTVTKAHAVIDPRGT